MALSKKTDTDKLPLPTNSSSDSFPSKYLEGIRNNDSVVLEKIYEKFLPSVIKFVEQNQGSEIEARDVFPMVRGAIKL